MPPLAWAVSAPARAQPLLSEIALNDRSHAVPPVRSAVERRKMGKMRLPAVFGPFKALHLFGPVIRFEDSSGMSLR